MNVNKPELDMQEVCVALQTALKDYQAAEAACKETERAKLAMMNNLNNAQKQFDAAIAQIKKDPPWNSDWANKSNRG